MPITTAEPLPRIDLRFKGVGRIKRAPSTTNPRLRASYIRMLKALADQGHVGILKSIRDGDLSFASVYERWKSGELNKVRVVAEVLPLEDTMLQWLETAQLSDAARFSYRDPIKQLGKRFPDAVVTDLPEVIAKYRDECEARGIARSFQYLRTSVVLAFLRDMYGKSHALHQAVSDIKPLKVSSHVHTGMARSVVDVVATVKAMEEPFGDMFWTMCITGMGTGDYFNNVFDILPDRVHIHGKKNKNRDRVAPLVSILTRPERQVKVTRKALHAVQPTWELYDGRRSFQHWCEMAGIPIIRIRRYVGHKAQNISEVYRQHEVDGYLRSDAELLRSYIKRCIDEANNPKPNELPASPPDLLATLTLNK